MTKTYNREIATSSQIVDVILRNDLASFLRAAFAEVSPGVTLVWGEYLDLVSARLAKVVSGDCRNLIITMPPRHLKSICVSVALPAFFLGHHPSAEILAISYGQELARKFAEDTRSVMQSEFYARIFDTRLASARQAPHALRTTAGGIRRATSIDGAATGIGRAEEQFNPGRTGRDHGSRAQGVRQVPGQARPAKIHRGGVPRGVGKDSGRCRLAHAHGPAAHSTASAGFQHQPRPACHDAAASGHGAGVTG